MKFWASAEVDLPADYALNRARLCVEPFLNAAFAASSLQFVKAELRYVPIVMSKDGRANYPARSKLLKSQRIYDCAPQLNYEIFVEGTLEDQLREYIRGISESAPHLADLGATPEQIAEFNRILETAVERVLNDRPDKTRH